MWRRQHCEGPIDDLWTFPRLYNDETPDDLKIVESRKERYLGRYQDECASKPWLTWTTRQAYIPQLFETMQPLANWSNLRNIHPINVRFINLLSVSAFWFPIEFFRLFLTHSYATCLPSSYIDPLSAHFPSRMLWNCMLPTPPHTSVSAQVHLFHQYAMFQWRWGLVVSGFEIVCPNSC
jgi:hypothetical protein